MRRQVQPGAIPLAVQVSFGPRRTRKRWFALLLIFVLLLILATLEAVRYVQLYQNLRVGRTDLLAAESVLQPEAGLAISPSALHNSQLRLAQGRGRLQRASQLLSHDPLLLLAGRLPLLERQVVAIRSLTSMGEELAAAGIEAAGALGEFEQTRDSQSETLAEKLLPALQASAPHVTIIEADFKAAQASRRHIASHGLLPPLRSAVAQFDGRAGLLQSVLLAYQQATAVAPDALGYKGPRTYLVLAMDNTEILGTGGFVLMYGLLTFDQGRLEQRFFDNVTNINWNWPPPDPERYVAPPRPLATYLLRGWPMGVAEASWWPDFPTVAQKAIEIYHVNSGRSTQLDGVIGVNFQTLERLLQVIGPVTLPQYGETVSAANVIEKTLILTNPQAPRPGERDRYDFAGAVAGEIISRTLTIDSPKWMEMLAALRDMAGQKEAMVYAVDPPIQAIITDRGLDGGIRPATDDYVMAVDSSVGTTKLNLVVQSYIALDVRLLAGGGSTDTLTLTYLNPYSAWSEGKDPRLLRVVSGPAYIDYARVLTPSGSTLTQVVHDGSLSGVEDAWSESGRTVYGSYFNLPLDTMTRFSYTYTVPPPSGPAGPPGQYRLVAQKQPGTGAVPLAVTVHPPPGSHIRSSELDGQRLAGAPGHIPTDLRQDRAITVAWGPNR
ncbi:MAG: DUF4012 domain-containing protein [Dehalococcoidia bacterium]